MPAVSAPSKVLVTGANGFIAIWIVRYLLERGYTVRGTIRDTRKGDHLKRLFHDYMEKSYLEFAVVNDFTSPGVFDEAVRGVDAIIHTASPVIFTADDPNELIDPAVKGTLSVLESAMKFAPSVRRIVFVSSAAAVENIMTQVGMVDESEWNTESPREVELKGRSASSGDKYRTSKVLAERVGWDFTKNHQHEISWDFVATCPTYVYGPMLHEMSSIESLNATMKQFYDGILRDELTPLVGDDEENVRHNWVDVRDVAMAHVFAIETPEAADKRFVLNAHAAGWKDWRDAAHGVPLKPIDATSPPTVQNLNKTGCFYYDDSRAVNILHMKFRDLNTTAKDIVTDFKNRGWAN